MQSILGINLSFRDFVSSPCSIQVVESTRKNVLGYAKVPEMFDTFDRSVRSYYPASFKRQCCNGVARRSLRACVDAIAEILGLALATCDHSNHGHDADLASVLCAVRLV